MSLLVQLLELAVDISMDLQPIIEFRFPRLVASTTNVFYTVACQIVKLLIDNKIPNLNRPSLVVGRIAFGSFL